MEPQGISSRKMKSESWSWSVPRKRTMLGWLIDRRSSTSFSISTRASGEAPFLSDTTFAAQTLPSSYKHS